MIWLRQNAVALFALAVAAWLAISLWRALAASRRASELAPMPPDTERIRARIRQTIEQRKAGVPPPLPATAKPRAAPGRWWRPLIDPFGGPWRRTWLWLRERASRRATRP